MPCVSRVKLPLALLAVTTALALQLAPVQAQKSEQTPAPEKVQPGNEATAAVGSQVPPMKPNCEPKTPNGERQPQHAPTAGLSQKVPTMTAEADCADTSPPANAQAVGK